MSPVSRNKSSSCAPPQAKNGRASRGRVKTRRRNIAVAMSYVARAPLKNKQIFAAFARVIHHPPPFLICAAFSDTIVSSLHAVTVGGPFIIHLRTRERANRISDRSQRTCRTHESLSSLPVRSLFILPTR